MEFNFEGKRAIVCGSTQGIGKAIAIKLAECFASVTLVARNEESLKGVLSELPTGPSQKHDYIVADFNDPESLKIKVEKYLQAQKKADILINNTGGPPSGKAIDASTEDFILAFNSHLICNHILVKAVLPFMKQAGSGRIINIISTSVKMPIPDLGVSNTIRGAVASWSKTLSNELGPFNITVNNVLPGFTNTGRLGSLVKSKAEKSGVAIQEMKEIMESDIPVKRFAEPEEVAYAAAFLASEGAAYITGTNLTVDGGRTGCL